jgi:outer membrane protein OmpA-like peptidoglycan-associated protein
MKHFRDIVTLVLVVAVAAGCATAPPRLSRDQALQETSELAQLAQALVVADHNQVDLLAPAGFAAAKSTFEQAVTTAQRHRTDEAKATAAEAGKALRTAEDNAATSRKLMREVLAVRDRARVAAAPTLFPQEYASLETRLHDAVHLVELGRLEPAKERRAALIRDYADLELQSIKKGSVQAAQATLKRVKERDAARYAPKTFKLAEEKMALALSILEADRTRQGEANAEAAAAIWHAERAAEIAEVIKDFERRDFSEEDKVLWYQDQLSEIAVPLGESLPFNRENRAVVIDMQGAIAALAAQQRQTAQTLAERDEQIAALKAAHAAELQALAARHQQELAAASERLTDTQRRQREYQQQFDQVQALFDPAEATVYRQGGNVLIVVHGFHFPTGKSVIEAENFALMNKIQRAIETFPGCKIEVTGHTDATGEPEFNLQLSQDRAFKVAKFLHDVGGVESERLSSEGFGDTKPVATNKTAEGRAENRRVELLLVNSE